MSDLVLNALVLLLLKSSPLPGLNQLLGLFDGFLRQRRCKRPGDLESLGDILQQTVGLVDHGNNLFNLIRVEIFPMSLLEFPAFGLLFVSYLFEVFLQQSLNVV